MSDEEKPTVEYFPASKPWRESDGAVHLVGMQCPACGNRSFPARTVCHACGNDDGLQPSECAPAGTLYSYSQISVGPRGFPKSYVLGFVDLDDGVRVLSQVEDDAAELAVDQRVRVVLGIIRTRGDGTPVVSYKFRGVEK